MGAEEIKKALHVLEGMVDYWWRISSLPDCNTCAKKKVCPHRPEWGAPVRINCFDYEGEEEMPNVNERKEAET